MYLIGAATYNDIVVVYNLYVVALYSCIVVGVCRFLVCIYRIVVRDHTAILYGYTDNMYIVYT